MKRIPAIYEAAKPNSRTAFDIIEATKATGRTIVIAERDGKFYQFNSNEQAATYAAQVVISATAGVIA
jgi:hypothetical protein